jgi:hypothetical protein
MPETAIRLDKSRPFGTCHGERVPADPHYRVHYWQGGKMAGHLVQLPFDANGELVPDDGKTEPFQAMGVLPDGKSGMVMYDPLYTERMREFRAAKLKKMGSVAVAGPQEIEEPGEVSEEDADGAAPEDEVNLVAWLKGEQKYQVHLLRAAAKKRYNKSYGDKLYPNLVIDLVLDEKLVPEEELCEQFKAMLKADAKAKSKGTI